MALPDLTNQYIQDTYQRLLQISSSGDLTDGTGSLFIPPNAISASYATSASYEIIKEVSSSFADTASYVNPLQQNVELTGSLNISGSVDISLPEGSAFTIHEPDIDQQNRFDFNFIQGNPILEISSRSTSGSIHLRQDDTGAGLLFDSLGKIKYITGGTTYGVNLTTSGFSPNTPNQLNLGNFNRRWKDFYINNGDKISFGVSDSSDVDLVSLRHTTNKNTLVMSGSSDVILDVKGSISASGNISGSDLYVRDGRFSRDGFAAEVEIIASETAGGIVGTNTSDNLILRRFNIPKLTLEENLNLSHQKTKISGSLSVDGTSRTLFTSCSMVYSGSNVTQVTQSYEAGTQQITNILYSGSFEDGNPLSISVTGSDGINKLYSMTYSEGNITQILVT